MPILPYDIFEDSHLAKMTKCRSYSNDGYSAKICSRCHQIPCNSQINLDAIILSMRIRDPCFELQ